jgi:hypothetical protein
MMAVGLGTIERRFKEQEGENKEGEDMREERR